LERREDAERRLRELSARCERAEKDEAYLDSAARRELGLVAVDEVEFHFTGGSGAQPEPPSGG
jgi:cell division protein FtsB